MSTIITAMLIIITTISIPLLFIYINKQKTRKRNRRFLNLFSEEGSKLGLCFSGSELLQNKIIGLDGTKQALLVLHFENPGDVICIAMKEVKNCRVERKFESIVVGTEKKPNLEVHLSSIDLTFSFKNNAAAVSVSIYDSNVNGIYEMAELETKAKTWEALLSKLIVKEQKADSKTALAG